MMAGTLILLKQKGYQIHLFTVGNGSCGTDKLPPSQIIRIRQKEAQKSAEIIGGIYHPGLVPDIEIFYEKTLLKKIGALVRRIKPEIVLVPASKDYMYDHQNVSRLLTTALFCRGMRNFRTIPSLPPYSDEVFLYHALPYGLKDGLRRVVRAGEYVNITSVIETKEKMLQAHQSQKKWLDRSQGLDSYLKTMREMSAQVARMSGQKSWKYAEGWRRHLHLGLSTKDEDLLKEILGDKVVIDQEYEKNLGTPFL
jgi:LmbE family N-acetylglucosaminyl deacetylase